MQRRRVLGLLGGALGSAVGGCLGTDPDTDREGTDPTPEATETKPDDGTGSTPGETDAGSATETDGGDVTTDDPGRRYEECSREIVPYESLPPEVRAEVDAALAGRYEADRVYLAEAMDTEESYVSFEGDYYDPTVTDEDGREVLSLRRVDPRALPNPRPVSVEQTRDGERTITLRLVAEDGTVLIEETRDLWPGGDVEFGRTARVGTHDLRVTVARDGDIEESVTETVRIDESHFDVLVVVDPDGVSVTGAVADLVECEYDT